MEEEEGGKGLQLCPPWLLVWDGGGKGGENGRGEKREREREGGGERVNDKVEDETKSGIRLHIAENYKPKNNSIPLLMRH